VNVAISTLNGDELYRAFSSGLLAVQRQRDYLNRINVFPVPDGDTGTNITATLTHALESARVSESAAETLASIADAALVGARGNSGVILAQFLGGLSESLHDAPRLSKERLVDAAENAGRRAREAVAHPQDGTILSVMRAWAEALRREVDSAGSIGELLRKAAPALTESLEKTQKTLPELEAAGVVDAGASGFVEFVAGAERYIDGGLSEPLPLLTGAGREPSLEEGFDVHESGSVHFRYCAEALVSGDAIDDDMLRRTLEPLGDSLIVAGGRQRARIHLHTDEPARAFASIAAAGGRVVQQKVDDMRLQYEVAHERKYPIAIVTDSICDLPRTLLDRYQIHVVPLHLRIDEREYLDRLTIDPELFFDLAERSRQFPSSSQPAGELFARLFSYLSSYYESIIAIHTSGHLSGTAGASARAAAALPDAEKISVLDSHHLSVSLGLVVLRAAEAVAAGKSREEVVHKIESYTRKAEILVSVRTLRYMVRGGRVRPMAGALGKALNLKPIVSLDADGKSILYGKAFSVRRNLEKIVEMVARRHAESPLRCYAVVHGHDLEAGRELAAELERALGFPPLFIEEISSIVALNAGRGAVAVATMVE
jgi:DegV family protein with EDD domain